MDSYEKFEYVESEFVTRDFGGRRGTKTTITDVSTKKRVLLVCVYNKKGTLITHDIIYRLFMTYGEIAKILIFEKCKNWKIFVEMETLEQAEKARDGLNNFQLFDDGSKMTVYYAKVDQIIFQNNNSGGVDYRELKRRKQKITPHISSNEMDHPSLNVRQLADQNQEKHRNYSVDYSELYRNFESVPNITSKSSPSRNGQEFVQNPKLVQKRGSIFALMHPGTISNENNFSEQLSSTNQDEDDEADVIQVSLTALQIQESEDDFNIEKQIEGGAENSEINQEELLRLDQTDQQQERGLQNLDQTPNSWQEDQIDPSSYVSPLYILENKKSRVVYVRGLEKKNLSTKHIYNLFSNFGNIELILSFTDKRYCLIQFETQEDATTAKEHLDSLKVMMNQMRIFYSNYESIKDNQECEKVCEIWKGDRHSFRFRNGKQISVNPVTNTLHLSNLKADTCKREVIVDKFSKYGVIEAFHPIVSGSKFMCHVKFSSTEEATNALCYLHEEEILGRKIHISFTRTRISPMITPETQSASSLNLTSVIKKNFTNQSASVVHYSSYPENRQSQIQISLDNSSLLHSEVNQHQQVQQVSSFGQMWGTYQPFQTQFTQIIRPEQTFPSALQYPLFSYSGPGIFDQYTQDCSDNSTQLLGFQGTSQQLNQQQPQNRGQFNLF